MSSQQYLSSMSSWRLVRQNPKNNIGLKYMCLYVYLSLVFVISWLGRCSKLQWLYTDLYLHCYCFIVVLSHSPTTSMVSCCYSDTLLEVNRLLTRLGYYHRTYHNKSMTEHALCLPPSLKQLPCPSSATCRPWRASTESTASQESFQEDWCKLWCSNQ